MVDVTQSNDEENGPIIELIKKIIGEPRNYGLSQEEKEELEYIWNCIKSREESKFDAIMFKINFAFVCI